MARGLDVPRLRDWWETRDHAALEQEAPRLFALLQWLFEGRQGERPRLREELDQTSADTPASAPAEAPAANAGPEQESDPPAVTPSVPGQPSMASSHVTGADGRGYSIIYAGGADARLVVDVARMQIVLPSQLPFFDLGSASPEHLELSGDWSHGLSLPLIAGAVGRLDLAGGASYTLTADDTNVAGGGTAFINGRGLGAGDRLVFDGSAETDGAFTFEGGAGADDLTGGSGADFLRGAGGADRLAGGDGADLFVYRAAAESSGAGYDLLADFDAAEDRIVLPGEVAGFADAVTAGTLSAATIDEDLAAAAAGLGAGEALLFTPDAGDLAGKAFLIVDGNGEAGYQAGEDFVFNLAGPASLEGLTTAIFA